MTIEVQKLLSLLSESGAQLQVSNGWLLVSPPEVAQRFSGEIQRLKPEILLALGHCPKCSAMLTIREGDLAGRAGKLKHCPKRVGHYESWSFI